MNNIDISVILPIKSSKVKDFEEFFEKAIQSIREQELVPSEVVVVPTTEESLNSFLESFDFGELNCVIKPFEGEPSFQAQINHGVESATNEWVSIFEFDDEYSKIWFKNVKTYIDAYPETDSFLPVVIDVDEKNQFAGFTNEATFAANFTQDYSKLSLELLEKYQNFQSSGLVIRKDKFIDFGGFKPSMKLTFVYEFFLRMTYNSVSFQTIPKLGYKHMNMRDGSIFWNYKYSNSPVTPDEAKFWMDAAKKEYFFIQDREINYEPELVDEFSNSGDNYDNND